MWKLGWEKVKLCWLILGAITASFVSQEAVAKKGFAISPPIIEASLFPGQTKLFTVELINKSKEKAEFKIYPALISEIKSTRDLKGEQWSCADWITVRPERVVLLPGQSRLIGIKISVPGGVRSSGRYATVMFEYVPESLPSFGEERRPRVGFIITWRLACKVILAVGREFRREVEITDLVVLPSQEEGRVIFKVEMKNKGNIHADVKGMVILRTKKGRRCKSLTLPGSRIYPSLCGKVEIKCDFSLPIGEYIAEAVVDYGGVSPARKKVPFVVKERGEEVEEPESKVEVLPAHIFVEPISLLPQDVELNLPVGSFRIFFFTLLNRYDFPVEVKAEMEGEGVRLFPTYLVVYPGKEGKIGLRITASEEGSREVKIKFAVTRQGSKQKLRELVTNVTIKVLPSNQFRKEQFEKK